MEISGTLLQKIKNVNIKDVVYWAAESWEAVTEQSLKKSWKKSGLPSNPSKVKTPRTVKGESRCEDTIDNDVNEWMAADGASHENLTDEYIFTALSRLKSGDLNDEPEGDMEQFVSHADATAALDLTLHYVEQQDSGTSADIMFIRKWRNKVSLSRFSSLRQKKLTDFLSLNKLCFYIYFLQ
ncbi:hypothetical protein PR048_014946 [Dryococelus australis]|uniref:DDE-1 domain-containing protein n=1 Tax=Dryococelus australis TaxID=614101 RepID=A0ABQ9HFM0_9NEOP|nr:hypothetical protein PR048_014946 [Dryococelus australis]